MNDLSTVGKISREDCALNTHGGYEIICFTADGRLTAGGDSLSCPAGCVAVIPPLTPREIACERGLHAILERALLPVKNVTVIPADSAEEVISAVSQAAKHSAENIENEGVLFAYGGLIAALIAAYVAPNGYSPAVKAIMDDAEKHLGDPTYSLENTIRTLPLNYDYVRKMFKKETGMTPHEYLTGARMKRAKDIMLSGVTNRYSNYSVTQIAEACGYSEPLYFSRVFKKYFGVAPSHYMNEQNQ